VVPDRQPVLQFAIGLDSSVYTERICGGGVTFTIEARDSQGRIQKLYSRYIDPKHDVRERKWFTEQLSLRQFRGQSIDLLFSTDGGEDTCNDWSGWADLRFQGQPTVAEEFQKVYDKEVRIYRVNTVLPRAAVFHRVEVVDDDAALARLVDPNFNIFNTGVVSANRLHSADRQIVQQINDSPEELGEAEIERYGSQHVTVSAILDKPGLLVLNDTDYPGWRAYVDGKAANIIAANYLFRGVLLPAGHHQVDFKYQPNSLRLGLLISSLSLMGALIAIGRGYAHKHH
jgi:hypothetical protein